MNRIIDSDLSDMRAIKPKVLSLKTALLSGGMTKDLLCKGENSLVTLHCYSSGMGEKHGLHAHKEEEHVFIVLHGTAVFSDIDGKLPPMGRNQGLWLPKGCFYEFYNPGPDSLVVIRFGALQKGANPSTRITPEGEPILGRASQNPDRARPVPIDGQFFE